MRRDSRPSLLVKYTQCRVYGEDRERRGRWQMKEALITSERECLLHGYLASMGQIHPKNAPGRTDRFSSFDESQSCASIGNGSCVTVATFPLRQRTRSGCSSAAMMFV